MRWPVLLGALCACTEAASPIPDECNPLGGDSCLLPWPSMAYTRRDTEFSATGFRLALPSEAMPRNRAGAWIHPAPFNRWDGFSTIGPLLVQFPTGVSATTLPADADASLAADSSIVVLDVADGARVPFVASVDGDTIAMQPLRRLRGGHRYAVAIRDRVRGVAGEPLAIPEAFAALRDGTSYGHSRFAALRDGASEMFAALDAIGVTRDELVLAWDFVTASDDFVRSDLVTMRNQALLSIGSDGEYLMFTLAPAGDGRYEGSVAAPNFLAANGTGLLRDEWEWDAHPMQDGMHDVSFAVLVPPCASTALRPAILVGDSLDDPFVQRLAVDNCAIAIGPSLERFPAVTEKLAQSVIDLGVVAALARGPLARAFSIDPANVTLVDTSLVGATFLAYETAPMRAAVAPAAWDPEESDAVTRALLGMSFEPYDPQTTAAELSHATLVWSTGHDGAESVAREMSVSVLAPSVMAPWGMTLESDPMPSGLVIYDHASGETPALARQIAQVIAGAPLTMQCALAGVPAPCDCATGACD